MNARAVARVAFDVNFAAAHSVARGVARIAVYEYTAFVHRISYCVLRIAVDYDVRAVEVCSKSVAGSAVDGYFFAAQTRSYKSLSLTVVYLYLRSALPNGIVQIFVGILSCVYNHIITY